MSLMEMTNQSKEIVQLLCLVMGADLSSKNLCKLKLKVSKASALGGRGHIPLPHPPPLVSKLAMHSYITDNCYTHKLM